MLTRFIRQNEKTFRSKTKERHFKCLAFTNSHWNGADQIYVGIDDVWKCLKQFKAARVSTYVELLNMVLDHEFFHDAAGYDSPPRHKSADKFAAAGSWARGKNWEF